jgi:hypothetical protein
VWDTAIAMLNAGSLPAERPLPISADLARAYGTAGKIYKSGEVSSSRAMLAMNFLLDRAAEGWARDLAKMKAEAGDCDTAAPLAATGALTGSFLWQCWHGHVRGSLELSPTLPTHIQKLQLDTEP